VLCCLTIGHLQPVADAMRRLVSIVRPGGRVVVSDFHPDALRRGWKRTFRHGGETVEIETSPYRVEDLRIAGVECERFEEPCFGAPERPLFEIAGKGGAFEQVSAYPAIYVGMFRRSAP
jgi:hypothetical protein